MTLVQSLTEHFAVAATLKWVHGYAAAGLVPDGDRDDLLDGAGDLPDESSQQVRRGHRRDGRSGQGPRGTHRPKRHGTGFLDRKRRVALTLNRQTRAGISYVGVPGLIVAADFDLERAAGSLGDVRDVAAGAEARLFKRVSVRSGFRFNTLGDEPGGRRAGLQPRRQRRDVPVPAGRCPGHARVPRRATEAGASRRGSGTEAQLSRFLQTPEPEPDPIPEPRAPSHDRSVRDTVA